MWSVFSPYGSSYTIDLEALQDVVVGLLWNLVFDIDDQALVAVINDDQPRSLTLLEGGAPRPR